MSLVGDIFARAYISNYGGAEMSLFSDNCLSTLTVSGFLKLI